MNILMITMRAVHVLSGIFWVGTTFFMLLFLEPAIRAAGKAGSAVMGRLSTTKFPIVYVIDSNVFQISWIVSPPGIVLTVGALAGILAALEGIFVQSPATARMVALQKEIQAAGGPPSPAQVDEMQLLTGKIARASRLSAVLMVIAVLGMTSAREFGEF